MSAHTGLFCAYSAEDLQALLGSRHHWRPFPPAADRTAWQQWQQCPLNNRRAGYLIGRAEGICPDGPARNGNVPFTTAAWPELNANEYRNFIRTGDREHYEGPYFQRRHNLAVLTLAECIEGRGRFLDEVINGLWMIGSEPTWCIPAHTLRLKHDEDFDSFPDLSKPSVDLFASETAFALAECLYLLEAELNARCPGVVPWMRGLIDERIVAPVETRDDFWWLQGVNNWTPWCCSNTLGALLYTNDDPARTARVTRKLLEATQRYFDHYSPDGGCDEGPMYWTVSPGALQLLMEMLYDRSGGRLNFYDDPKIRAMGAYLPKVHLAGRWLVNFADARDSDNMKRASAYRYAERIGDEAMRNLALRSMRGWRYDGPVEPLLPSGHCCGDLVQWLRELWWIPGDARPVPTPREAATWFPDLQVAVWRAGAQTEERGLIFAGKAGHNAENHNHNDLGHFILMLDGRPGIIDIGIGMYSRLNFSDRRYTLWSIRGNGHNGPVVNGVEQAAGEERKTTAVLFRAAGADAELAMNLEAAYPEEAGLLSLRRGFALSGGDDGCIALTDAYALKNPGGMLELNLYTTRAARLAEPGRLLLAADAGRELVLAFDPQAISVEIGERSLLDEPLLCRAWGTTLRHLRLTHRAPAANGEYTLRFFAQ